MSAPLPPSRPRPVPARPGEGSLAGRLAEILRVDHAGELGAVAIYRGQKAVLGEARGRERVYGHVEQMEAQEQAHLSRFESLILERRVRPTALAPVWRLAGFALGVGTALLGERAAHACTEAVETAIEQHYADQIEELSDVEPVLAAELAGFREEEIVHRDLARAEGAQRAPGYRLLSAVIGAGCRAAIRISEKI